MKYKQYVSSCFSLNGHDHSCLYTQSYSVLGDYDEDTPPVPFDGLAHLIIYYHFRLCHNTLPLPLPLSCPGKPEKINLNEAGTESKPVTAVARLFTHQMGQSSSTVSYPTNQFLISPEPSDFTDEIKIGPLTDYTDGIPDECLACIFQLLNAADRKRSSLVCKRWLRVDGQSRRRLSLNAQSEITSYVPSIFTRFDSVAKLSLRCDRKSLSLNDDALRMISIQCESLTRLKLRGCREVTELGMADFAKNCKNLTKFSCGSCNFGAKGINMLLKYCIKLEELTIKRLRSVNYGNDLIVPGAAALSLKSICLKELVNGQCFETLVVECQMLKTLKVIRCLGDWDNVLVKMGNGNDSLSDVHLERLQLSDIGLGAISKCVNIDSLHIVKNPECSNLGLVSVAENCKKLKKLHIDGWKINQIGDEGLMAVAKQCPDLQELVLIGVHVTHFSMAAIASNCRRLERLALCGSGAIGDAEIACIAAKCVELKKLCIKGCAISDFAIEALAWGCPNLVKVKVRKCRGVSSEAVDWLLRRKGSLVVSFDAIESEGLDASGSDVVGQESGVEFPVMGGQVVVGDGPSVSNGRLAQFRAKMGLFASRNLVPRAFHRPSNHGDSSKSNL